MPPNSPLQMVLISGNSTPNVGNRAVFTPFQLRKQRKVPRDRFRVRYDRIVDFDPFYDGLGLVRDAQTAKPQSFRTGDGWFAFNIATNLAQM